MTRASIQCRQSPRWGVHGIFFCFLFLTQLSSAGANAALPPDTVAQQWRVLELVLHAEREHPQPAGLELTVYFHAPDGNHFAVPAFWDGEKTWKVRFTPTQAGEWKYDSSAPQSLDNGLDAQHGNFTALPSEGANPFHLHGGFLTVSPNGRHLTYSDGTPFFWLGDTWWYCPSKLCPIDSSSAPEDTSMFRTLVDTRSRQGYTVAQMLFVGPRDSQINLHRPGQWAEEDMEFWRKADEYLRYAADNGILVALGIGWHRSIDAVPFEELKLLWRNVVARFGSYPVTWLIVGEYNLDNHASRVSKVLALGKYIKEIDPYKRAMSVHPWYAGGEKRQAWNASWLDFVMLQGAHGGFPAASIYKDAYDWQPTRPFLEDEANYEGIRNATAEVVRTTAYRAIQLGSFGYTYGSHGLWHPIHSPDKLISSVEQWGKPLLWWEALQRDGGRQMGYLRKFYQSLPWWRLEPRPEALDTGAQVVDEKRPGVTAKADGDSFFVLHFPPGVPANAAIWLNGLAVGEHYVARWFNPRTGEFLKEGELRVETPRVLLPDRPDKADWLLQVGKTSMAP